MMINGIIRKDREPYEAPGIWVLEVENNGIICASGGTGPEGTRENYGKPEERNY